MTPPLPTLINSRCGPVGERGGGGTYRLLPRPQDAHHLVGIPVLAPLVEYVYGVLHGGREVKLQGCLVLTIPFPLGLPAISHYELGT